MARFDVYGFTGHTRLVVDVQADILKHLTTRIVIPLYPFPKNRTHPLMSRLNPVFQINNIEYYLNTAELTAVPVALLNRKKSNLENHRQDIIDAVDFVMQGF